MDKKELEKELRIVLEDFCKGIKEKFNEDKIVERVMNEQCIQEDLKYGTLEIDTFNGKITEFAYYFFPQQSYRYTTEEDYDTVVKVALDKAVRDKSIMNKLVEYGLTHFDNTGEITSVEEFEANIDNINDDDDFKEFGQNLTVEYDNDDDNITHITMTKHGEQISVWDEGELDKIRKEWVMKDKLELQIRKWLASDFGYEVNDDINVCITDIIKTIENKISEAKETSQYKTSEEYYNKVESLIEEYKGLV